MRPVDLVTDWAFEPTMAVVALVGAGLYLAGVRGLARRGRRWPPARTAAWMAGVAALVVATQSGLARYDTTSFSAHMGQHLMLGMVVPLLLALAAPIMLAMQALDRRRQRGLIAVVHSPVVAAVTHPVVGWALFGGTLVVLYLTPLFELSLRNDLVHAGVHVHFLVVGAIFVWPLVGLDPVRWRMPYGARLLAVLLVVPFHAFLGLALLGVREPLGDGTWSMSDQRFGIGLLWGLGELLAIGAAAVVFFQWAAADEREAARADRIADRALS
ncbi:MAG: cytochrome c oxidase assembly protein [Acidimicrobiales bacterium]